MACCAMGLDSVEIILNIEDVFGIRISDAQAQKCVRVQDLYDVTMQQIEREGVDPRYMRCLKCQYNLRGLDKNTCPECGTEFVPLDELKEDAVMRILIELLAKTLAMHPKDIKPHHHIVKDLKVG